MIAIVEIPPSQKFLLEKLELPSTLKLLEMHSFPESVLDGGNRALVLIGF